MNQPICNDVNHKFLSNAYGFCPHCGVPLQGIDRTYVREMKKAISLALDEFREFRLAIRAGNKPRNPELTDAAENLLKQLSMGAGAVDKRMNQFQDEPDEPEETEVKCPKCGGSGLTIEGWDCWYCDGNGTLDF